MPDVLFLRFRTGFAPLDSGSDWKVKISGMKQQSEQTIRLLFTFGISVRDFQKLPLLIISWAFMAIDSKVRLKKSKRYIIIGEIILTVFMIIAAIIGIKLRK